MDRQGLKNPLLGSVSKEPVDGALCLGSLLDLESALNEVAKVRPEAEIRIVESFEFGKPRCGCELDPGATAGIQNPVLELTLDGAFYRSHGIMWNRRYKFGARHPSAQQSRCSKYERIDLGAGQKIKVVFSRRRGR